MAAISLALKAAIGLLMVVSIIELSFISATVAWLHFTASGTFNVNVGGTTFALAGAPANLLVDQGHTSNGAAGTAFVVIGLGGILALWLQSRSELRGKWFSTALYQAWVAFQIPALLLTLAALAYVFAVTNAREGQTIDIATAAALRGAQYPFDSWTPQNWFSQVLNLDLADDGVRADIASHVKIMRGWEYNLIPFFIIQLVETVLAFIDFARRRKETTYGHVAKHETA